MKFVYPYGSGVFTIRCGDTHITGEVIDIPAKMISKKLAKPKARLKIIIDQVLGIGTENDLTAIDAYKNPLAYHRALNKNFVSIANAFSDAFKISEGLFDCLYYSQIDLSNDLNGN